MARRKQEETEPPGIVVLYTSLMILLLAFFILLNAISKVEETRVESVFQSLMGTFGFQQGGVSPLGGGAPDIIRRTGVPINPVELGYTQLRGLVRRSGLSGQVWLLRSKSIKTMVLPALLLFQPDSTEISPQGAAFLKKVAAIIRGKAYPITLNGHTDDSPGQRLDGRNNWDISCRRALAVLRFLVAQGVNPRRLAAFGLAGYHPLVPNDTPHHRQMNNRVDLVFDIHDQSMYRIPASPSQPTIDFRGFSFDLMNVPTGEKK